LFGSIIVVIVMKMQDLEINMLLSM
jgi:hypothetical protein